MVLGEMSTSYAFIFGRNPELSRLELVAVAPRFGLTVGKMIEAEIMQVTTPETLSSEKLTEIQKYLGGTVRIAELLAESPQRQGIVAAAAGVVSNQMREEGKLLVGISTWAENGRPYPAFRISKELKPLLTKQGRSVRMVTPNAPRFHLDAPQIIHNKLVEKGVDLVCIWTSNKWLVGVTRTVQDIADYTKRDFGIPKPNAVSGMLPPKLAQTMINLAVGSRDDVAIYDPFCGNGRVLLEGALLNLQVYGSDIAMSQVDDSLENLEWLRNAYGQATRDEKVWVADATKGPGMKIPEKFMIVSEPFLGKPLRNPLRKDQKEAWVTELAEMYLSFFTYWAGSSQKPEGMLMVFPKAMMVDGGSVSLHAHLVDRLAKIGYIAKVLFSYSRPDSLVHRDLVQITVR
jgi:tRNA G10  N-methylase Trm11